MPPDEVGLAVRRVRVLGDDDLCDLHFPVSGLPAVTTQLYGEISLMSCFISQESGVAIVLMDYAGAPARPATSSQRQNRSSTVEREPRTHSQHVRPMMFGSAEHHPASSVQGLKTVAPAMRNSFTSRVTTVMP